MHFKPKMHIPDWRRIGIGFGGKPAGKALVIYACSFPGCKKKRRRIETNNGA